jgi:rhodanese-related sulfurtransferase
MTKGRILGLISMVVLSALPIVAQHLPAEKGAPETAATRLHNEMQRGEKLMVIDVRTPKEFETGHVPGAVNVPLDELAQKIGEMKIPKDTTIVTVCEHGGRSSHAAVELRKMGYKTTSFCRLDSWRSKKYKVEKGNAKPKKSARLDKSAGIPYGQSGRTESA